jgi:hypothetical protein
MVAEYGGKVVGFMSVSVNVDSRKLRHLYHLEQFGNLYKYDNKEETVDVPNTIAINIFCIESSLASYSYQFIHVTFEAFKKFDYCIISHPPNTPELVLCRDMISIESRPGKHNSDMLYIASCFTNQEILIVRPAVDDDMPGIHMMLIGIPNREHENNVIDGLNSASIKF